MKHLMKTKLGMLTVLLLAGAAGAAFGADGAGAPLTSLPPPGDWHAQSLAGALGLTALFGLVGVLLAVLGYKLFDFCTPGDLHKEIIENKNVAAAIVAGAVILGVSVIIAAAIVG